MKETNGPLVSVIIPAYNAASYIEDAVRSVLNQTYKKVEIIVTDDGSSDDIEDVLRQFGNQIHYIRQQNRGPSAARNTGIRAARGNYLCFLDADDTWKPEKLELQLGFMAANPDVGLVFSDEEEANSDKIISPSLLAKSLFYPEIVSQPRLKEAATKLLIENFIPTSTVMTRRKCFDLAGFFDESLPVSEDRDMWLRIAAQFGIACIPIPLGKKRAHDSNISSNSEMTLRSRIKMWEKARVNYPALVNRGVVNALVADAYLELGYILLSRDHRKEARNAGWESITCFLRAFGRDNTIRGSFFSNRLLKVIALVPLTFLGWHLTHSLFQVKNCVCRKIRL
jgi:glycosyltransferase involved in cell wall biosynthesis